MPGAPPAVLRGAHGSPAARAQGRGPRPHGEPHLHSAFPLPPFPIMTHDSVNGIG